ncbi:rpsU-divergently transcribed protein [Pseudoroseomonas deserti]|uniref:RpsU-divergently transcribed protein n=1 Tax=Teichococcus deserti TaxID=1817963 RepID=A0A1V2H8N9_9PROT|nr:COQ9 family protein [Pseudoroseomonas deserti]ONG58981.1 rpsU-divergently transcribed protein [Pseudoroseomonas deserti]
MSQGACPGAGLERSAGRDAALRAMLPEVPRLGWSLAALRAGLAAGGRDPADAAWLFPDGPAGMVEAWCDLADRDMAAAAAGQGLEDLRIPGRIRALVALRLEQAAPHRAALRRALALLALPWNLGIATRATARTADAMWIAAGDASTDLSFHTRRMTLAGIYAGTLAFWLRSGDMAASMGFLDRRLAGLARLQKRRPKAGSARSAA